MQDDLTGGNLGGEVEVDESFIGGEARNMHEERKARVQNQRVALYMPERSASISSSGKMPLKERNRCGR
jgi:hypothetical protein